MRNRKRKGRPSNQSVHRHACGEVGRDVRRKIPSSKVIAEPCHTPSRLRELISYNPLTGVMIWRHREDAPKKWNARFVGTMALSSVAKSGYLRGCVDGVFYVAHRVAWAIVFGEWANGEIDHIDGDRSNNRIENLRVVTHAENNKNRCIQSNNSSGHMGVYWSKQKSRWQVRVSTPNVRSKHYGYFSALEAAINARDRAYMENGYHENHGRKWGR